MKNKINSVKAYYGEHPKRFWAVGIILALVLFGIFTHKPKSNITALEIKQADLKQTILATGQVTSETDLSLSFSTSGLISSIPVKVGDKVWKGQVLATLENSSEYATLKSAEANYRKVQEGASTEEVAVAQASLVSAESSLLNTKKVQDTLVENAHRELLNTDLDPILTSGTTGSDPEITGFYTGEAEGEYKINVFQTGNGAGFNIGGIETGGGFANTNVPVALGTKGLYIKFPSSIASNLTNTWTVLLPNKKSSNYITDFNAYQNALKNRDSAIASAESAVIKAKADLDLKKASARPADLGVAEAEVGVAKASYEKTVLRAPANGTVAHVDAKVGERADTTKKVVSVQDVGNVYVEANINETSIAKVSFGLPVSMTLDAFGPEVYFSGNVIHIDPSSTTTDGVANYVIKASINDTSGKYQIRPGMNANMTITAWDHPNVIAIPKAGITTNDDGSFTVNVITDEKKNKYEARVVTLGMLGDGNLIEVLTGLSAGEKIAVVTK
ncbi:MAG: efflux RND transporter periplasmic adaptor subunit [Candidatus Pacebacteria bacterium]|nr:efflux RND transporter periplasmic adaptor subunit [Candidatus Paceibacterota bacterium]